MERRLMAFIISASSVAALGLAVFFLPSMNPGQLVPDIPEATPPHTGSDGTDPKLKAHADFAAREEIDLRFKQAVAMLHAKKYDHAITALHRVLKLAPKMPEAHVNMGYALIGLKNYEPAADFFNTALNLRTDQVNAYYGLGLALKETGDMEGALGAMRSYIHLAPSGDPYAGKARAMLSEIEIALAEKRKALSAKEKNKSK